jgi:phosphoglycolate phosphatase-like HAD superfamily hydrolase
VRSYISASTGIQTILQVKWIAEQLTLQGREANSPWDYKAEYNRRLMEQVSERRRHAAAGHAEDYLIRGGKKFLEELRRRGVKLYAASGTDEEDVRAEAEILGVAHLFDEIAGAKPMSEDCSKEATLHRLISQGEGGLLVVGDGPVEIRLGRESGACALGVCGKEKDLCGIDDVKVKRLTAAKAHALVDCFTDVDGILEWMEG